MDRIAARTESKHPITGVATGFFDLDDITGGFQPGQLVILAARPSMGKTAFALNICDHAAIDLKIPVLFVSLEMGQLELAERLLCARSRVDGHKLRTGQNLGTREMTLLGKGYDELPDGAAVHRRHPRAEHAPDHRQRPAAQAPPGPRPDRGRLHPARRQRGVARQPPGADRQDQPAAQDAGPRAGSPRDRPLAAQPRRREPRGPPPPHGRPPRERAPSSRTPTSSCCSTAPNTTTPTTSPASPS